MGKIRGTIKCLDENDIKMIHDTSVKILSEIGFYIPNDKVLNLLEKNNCSVDYDKKTAKINPALIEKTLKNMQKTFSIIPNLYENKISFNKDCRLKLAMDTTPDIIELSGGIRRRGNLEDTLKGIVLGNYLDHVNMVSAYCLPDDIPRHAADVICYKNLFMYSKKPVSTWIYSLKSAEAIIEMAKVVAGGEEELRKKKTISYFSESISPLKFAPHTLDIMVLFAKYELPVFLGPMVTAGGSGPVTLAGAVSLQNAELLMGMVIIHMLNPGQPVVHAGLSHILDMKTGICSYGSPEQALLSIGLTQLARYYGIASCCNVHISDSNCCDFQRGYEAAATASLALAAGAEMLSIYGYGPVGIVGSGVGLSLEQMLIDNEGLSYLSRIGRGFEVNKNTLAFDVMRKVGIGGTFLQEEHTLKNFREQQWPWDLFLRQNYQIWEMEGRQNILARAKKKLDRIMAENYPPEPLLPSDIIKSLDKIEDDIIEDLKYKP